MKTTELELLRDVYQKAAAIRNMQPYTRAYDAASFHLTESLANAAMHIETHPLHLNAIGQALNESDKYEFKDRSQLALLRTISHLAGALSQLTQWPRPKVGGIDRLVVKILLLVIKLAAMRRIDIDQHVSDVLSTLSTGDTQQTNDGRVTPC